MVFEGNPFAKFRGTAKAPRNEIEEECQTPCTLVRLEIQESLNGTFMVVGFLKLNDGKARKVFFPLPTKLYSLDKALSALGMECFERFTAEDGLAEFEKQARLVRGKRCLYVVRHKVDASGATHVNKEIHEALEGENESRAS